MPPEPRSDKYAPSVHSTFALIAAAGGTLETLFIGVPSVSQLAYKLTLGIAPTFGDYALAFGAGIALPAVAAWLAIDELRAALRSREASKLEVAADGR